jgi:tetratricopeptide (TPR) repeat protein
LILVPGCASLAHRSRTPGPEATVVPGVPVRVFEDDRCGPGSLALVLSTRGDAVSDRDLEAMLPTAPRGGVLSVDLLLAARQCGFDAALIAGSDEAIRAEIDAGRPVILMLRLLDAPGAKRDVYHYVVADGSDPPRRLFRFQFGDGKARWASLEDLEGNWKATDRALLLVWPRADTDAVLGRAVSLEGMGRAGEAAALYRQVLAVRPDSVRGWVNLGNAEAGRGRREEAEKAYRRALQISPDDCDALNNLAWLLLEEGTRLEEAETLAAKAASQPGPDRPRAQDTLGRIQLARGRCADAAYTFGEALAAVEAIADPARADLRAGLEQAQIACDQRP